MTPPPHTPEEAPAPRQVTPLEIGEKLRRKRETLGLSLDEVGRQLRVEQRHLKALEDDNVAALPSPVFAKGYLRNYARLLDLDPSPLLAALEASQVDAQPPPLSPITKVSTGPKILGEFPWEKLLTAVGSLLVITVVLWVGNVIYGLFKSASEDQAIALAPPGEQSGSVPLTLAIPEAPPVESDSGALSLPLPPAESEAPASEPDIETAAPELAVAPPEPPAEATVTLNFSDDSWVELVDDTGKRLVSRVGKSGQSLTASGIPPISVVLGNAPAVTVEYNGEPVQFRQPRRGQVAKFKLGE